ncbi:uncharacterized protein BKCO1_5000196 [Diplodia corticola]|uniref:Uncharacterized protein n=1 Tax=Diplodia corticola TaxID=236234 RepID=A0A1J9RDC6_9PEZI|nr:uncharacterized protein BKCO1_5000196 [Diplodia corticola]OJD38090.1 hypothetical protein BKCO1_5000196 [Diplodia corticola]
MDDSALGDALFSPSKAAQQRAQAQDWQHVEAWLSSLYPGRALPTFERNEETLKALLELAAANERADEEATMLVALEEEVRHEMSEAGVGTADEEADKQLLHFIEENLTSDGKHSLDALAQLSTILNTPSADPELLAHELLATTTHTHTLTTHIATLSHLHDLLTTDLANLNQTLHTITTLPAFAPPPPSLSRQTADYARQTKALLPKLQEYADRLAALPLPGGAATTLDDVYPPPSPAHSPTKKLTHARTRSIPRPANANPFDAPGAAARCLATGGGGGGGPLSSEALAALAAAEREVADVRAAVARLEARVRAYKDLPADRDEARRVVREREGVLAEMRERRDGGFEALVG